MSELMLDVGQANELKLALRRAGWSNDDIKRLCEGSILADVREVLLGHAAITIIKHVIDCDADPFIPDNLEIQEHQKGGQLVWDASAVLFLADGQKDGKVIEGNRLRQELANRPKLNANVLDYLLANPRLIPEEWKGKYVYFWGTVYRDRDGRLFVRYLYCRFRRWSWGQSYLASDWDENYPAALRAS